MSDKLLEQAEALYKRLIRYCEKCLSGEIVCGKKQLWAIERFLRDLNNSKYYFDKIELLKFNVWASSFKHRAGVLAGKPIKLVDFQLFIVGNLLCIKRRDNNMRRFRKGYIQVARKNAKVLAC